MRIREKSTARRVLREAVILSIAALATATAAHALSPLPQERTTHLGVPQATLDGFAQPAAAAFGPAGDRADALWVAELGGGAVQPRVRAVGVDVDLAGRSAAESLVVLGEGVLVEPRAVALGGDGRVFVADTGAHAVLRFNAASGEHEVLGSRGIGAGSFVAPRDVALSTDGATLFVADLVGVSALELSTGAWRRISLPGVERADAVASVPGADGALLAVFDAARQRLDLFDGEGAEVARLAEWGAFPGQLSSPGGIAFADGLLFVADTENHRVQAFDPDAPRPLAYRFGVHAIRPGEGEGALHYPSDVAVRADGALLALPEPLDDRVQIFGVGEGPEPPPNRLRSGIGQPTAHLAPQIAASGRYLASLSSESHRVEVHDLRGARPLSISEFGGFGERFGLFRTPVGVALLDGGRTLFIAEEGARRLVRASLDVRPDEPPTQDSELVTFLDGVELGRLERPASDVAPVPGAVAAVGEGDARRIAVVDRANGRVLVLDDALRLVARSAARLGELGGVTPSAAGGFLVAVRRGPGGPSVVELGPDAAPVRSFGGGVLVAPDSVARAGSRVFVSDPGTDRIEIFEVGDEVTHVGGFGRRGLGPAEFHGPSGLCVVPPIPGAEGALGAPRLVVVDHGNHRGQIFDLEGNFLDGFGSRLYTAPLRRR
ncbi:MAG: NHL repeat-containing protein [Planctomycetota bacterium]